MIVYVCVFGTNKIVLILRRELIEKVCLPRDEQFFQISTLFDYKSHWYKMHSRRSETT